MILTSVLKSKIHRATVTKCDLNYEGSISIPQKLCYAANLMEGEKVDIYNINNGERFSTYVIMGDEDISINGAGARKAQIGDKIIIASYAMITNDEIMESGKLSFPTKIYITSDDNNTWK